MTRWPATVVCLKGLLTLVALFAGLAGWAALVPLSAAVIVPGRVEVDLNRQIIQHPDGGVVARLAVQEGTRVARGDVLLILQGATLRSRAAQLQARLDELRARQLRLRAERDGAPTLTIPPALQGAVASRSALASRLAQERRLFRARARSMRDEQARLSAQEREIAHQVTGIDAQITAADTQIALVTQEVTTQRSLLSRGLSQRGQVLALDRQRAALEGRRGALIASRAAARSQEGAARIALLRLTSTRRETAEGELSRLDPQIVDLGAQMAALQARIGRLTLRAPVAGVVYDLRIAGPQAVVRPADPILSIAPTDRPLIVAVNVPPRQVGDLSAGDRVRLRVTGLHDRLAPALRGHVLTVAPDTVTDSRTGRAFFRARIAIDPGSLPPGRPILPGMPVEAFIQTGARTPLAYLLGPVRNYFAHALHES